MREPDMWDPNDDELCSLVVKSGNATGTTIGRANGVFSIVREYFTNMSINRTSMEWAIITTTKSRKSFQNLVIRAQQSLTFVAISGECLLVVVAKRLPSM